MHAFRPATREYVQAASLLLQARSRLAAGRNPATPLQTGACCGDERR